MFKLLIFKSIQGLLSCIIVINSIAGEKGKMKWNFRIATKTNFALPFACLLIDINDENVDIAYLYYLYYFH